MTGRTRFIVRGGTHNGKYLKIRTRSEGTRKYAWANTKPQAHLFESYDAARGAARRYGGEVAIVL